VADTYNHTIREIDKYNMVKTIAGDGKIDNINARYIDGPGIAINSKGKIIVADTHNHVLREIDIYIIM